jgi:hypothetical protein
MARAKAVRDHVQLAYPSDQPMASKASRFKDDVIDMHDRQIHVIALPLKDDCTPESPLGYVSLGGECYFFF